MAPKKRVLEKEREASEAPPARVRRGAFNTSIALLKEIAAAGDGDGGDGNEGEEAWLPESPAPAPPAVPEPEPDGEVSYSTKRGTKSLWDTYPKMALVFANLVMLRLPEGSASQPDWYGKKIAGVGPADGPMLVALREAMREPSIALMHRVPEEILMGDLLDNQYLFDRHKIMKARGVHERTTVYGGTDEKCIKLHREAEVLIQRNEGMKGTPGYKAMIGSTEFPEAVGGKGMPLPPVVSAATAAALVAAAAANVAAVQTAAAVAVARSNDDIIQRSKAALFVPAPGSAAAAEAALVNASRCTPPPGGFPGPPGLSSTVGIGLGLYDSTAARQAAKKAELTLLSVLTQAPLAGMGWGGATSEPKRTANGVREDADELQLLVRDFELLRGEGGIEEPPKGDDSDCSWTANQRGTALLVQRALSLPKSMLVMLPRGLKALVKSVDEVVPAPEPTPPTPLSTRGRGGRPRGSVRGRGRGRGGSLSDYGTPAATSAAPPIPVVVVVESSMEEEQGEEEEEEEETRAPPPQKKPDVLAKRQ